MKLAILRDLGKVKYSWKNPLRRVDVPKIKI